MKQYIFSMFPSREKVDPRVQELAALVALYNFEQPVIDFVNWLQNNVSEPCFRYEYMMVNDETVLFIDVLWRDEDRRVGVLTPVETE